MGGLPCYIQLSDGETAVGTVDARFVCTSIVDFETEFGQFCDDRSFTATEVLGAKWKVTYVPVCYARDRLGVVGIALVLEEVSACWLEAVDLAERSCAEFVVFA